MTLLVGCLTSSGKYFKHIQGENKFNNNQNYQKWGWVEIQQGNAFDCHWKMGGLGRDEKFSLL